jgi:hypothetical protein
MKVRIYFESDDFDADPILRMHNIEIDELPYEWRNQIRAALVGNMNARLEILRKQLEGEGVNVDELLAQLKGQGEALAEVRKIAKGGGQ